MTFYKDTYVDAKRDEGPLPTFYVGGKLYMYDSETNVDFFTFLDIPFLEYHADDGIHLRSYVLIGNEDYKQIDFLKETGTKEYTQTFQVGKNTIEFKIESKYQNQDKKLNTLFELVDPQKSKKKAITSKYNIQTGQYLGARLNQDIPEKLLYRAGLDAFLKSLGSGGERSIDLQLGNELTPLQTALYLRDIEAVKTLLRYGANPSYYTNKRTPLQDAIVYQDADEEPSVEKQKETTFQLVKLLVEADADINQENGRKRTALWYASDSDNPKVYNYLLAKGAIVQGKNIEGESPINIIKKRIKNTKGNATKQTLFKTLKTLKNKRESQESIRQLWRQFTQRQTRRVRTR